MKTTTFKKRTFQSLVCAALVGLALGSCEIDFSGGVLDEAMVTTVVSDFPANDGLSVDRSGRVYASNFANFGGTQLLRVNPKTGEFETLVEDLVAPTGNALDRRGNLYIVNNVRFVSQEEGTTEGDVLRVSPNGSREVIATLPGFPSGIALDKNGNAFVSNFSFPGVHKIAPDGTVSLFADDPRLAGGVGIDFDFFGNLFVGNFTTGEVLKITTDGTVDLLATVPTVVEGFVIGYITHFGGSIFATGVGANIIYRIDMSGDVVAFAGSGELSSNDGSLTEASIATPNGITADPFRKVLYITELQSGLLRAIQFN